VNPVILTDEITQGLYMVEKGGGIAHYSEATCHFTGRSDHRINRREFGYLGVCRSL